MDCSHWPSNARLVLRRHQRFARLALRGLRPRPDGLEGGAVGTSGSVSQLRCDPENLGT